jgi:catechol 2,3-dioxygenase-like lactoylglutathione lyase family enzyme
VAPVIQHLAISVPEPERSAAYYSAALAPLGAIARRALYSSDRGERPAVVVVEHSLSLMLHPADAASPPPDPYAAGGVHHFAIHVDSRELVDEVTAAAAASGGRVSDGPRTFEDEYRFGYYGAFLRDPDEIKWEVFCYEELVAAGGLAADR